MKITTSSINNSGSVSFRGVKVSPEAVKRLVAMSERMGSVEQRMVIGTTALLIQPVIDLKNKKVDKKTREVSAARSIARAIVGTLTGIFVRYSSIKWAESHKAFSTTLLRKATQEQKNSYYGAMGTLLALGVMVFTNFLVDAPCINALQNLIAEHVFHHSHHGKKKHHAKNAPPLKNEHNIHDKKSVKTESEVTR